MAWTPRNGIVVDAGGRPVRGALVSVAWGTGPTPEVAVETDEEGRFRLHLPEGRYRLAAHTAGGAAGETETRGEAEEEIRIRLASSPEDA